jgi:hypothetical protein
VGEKLAEILFGWQDGAEAGEIGAEAGDPHAFEPHHLLDSRQKFARPYAFPKVAEVDHQDDVVNAAEPRGDPRDFLDDGQFRLEAHIDVAHHIFGPGQRRAAQEHDRAGNAAVAQAMDILEPRLGDPNDAAAKHRARHLRHAAGALGHPEHLNAGRRAPLDHRPRIALDAAKIDGYRGPGHAFR